MILLQVLPTVNLWRLFRSCYRCGLSAHKEGLTLLCGHCEMRLSRKFSQGATRTKPVLFRSLLIWNEQDNELGELLYALKGGSHRDAYAFFARHFQDSHAARTSFEGGSRIFLPAPPRQEGQEDHAFAWAQALAQLYSGEVHQPFLRGNGEEEQKQLSLSERRKKKICLRNSLDPQLQPSTAERQLIFCDDVVTSGSTALAAWEALGRPSNFEVWTIADRPRRRGES